MENIKPKWGLFAGLGIVLMVIGVLAISLPIAMSLTLALFLGWLLVAGGIFQLMNCFATGRWSGFWLHLVTSLLYLAAGLMVIYNPWRGLATLTLLLAAFFVIEGVIKIILAMHLRPAAAWSWTLFNGIIVLILGVMIWNEWPSDVDWVIGLLVGINLLFSGSSMLMLGLAARKA